MSGISRTLCRYNANQNRNLLSVLNGKVGVLLLSRPYDRRESDVIASIHFKDSSPLADRGIFRALSPRNSSHAKLSASHCVSFFSLLTLPLSSYVDQLFTLTISQHGCNDEQQHNTVRYQSRSK